MRAWTLGAAILLAVLTAGCGGNTTTVGVNISGPSAPPISVIVNNSVQFAATATGINTTTVFWQICLPAGTSTTPPTRCTPGQGPAGCNIPSVSNPITGYGTITPNGLYTAPPAVPTPRAALVVAKSCVNANAFNSIAIIIDSGIRVSILPLIATIDPCEQLQFTANVTGTSNPVVTWTLASGSTTAQSSPPPLPPCATLGNGIGFITNAGLYMAANNASAAVTVTATSAADTTQAASVTVSFGSGAAPTITAIGPSVAVQGSVQQDIYLTGTNFLSTETVLMNGVPVPTTFLNPSFLRATVSAVQLAQAGSFPVAVQEQNGTVSALAPSNLTVFAGRPAVVGSSPDSVTPGGSANVALTGGYFSTSATTVTFDGAQVSAIPSGGGTSTRQWTADIPSSALGTPGLYSLIVQNAGVTAGQPSLSGLNLAVTAPSRAAPLGPSATVTLTAGSGPTGVAIDYADDKAVIANTGNNSVTILDLSTNPPSIVTTLTSTDGIRPSPIGVAVDDLLPHPVALVVNSTDQSVTAIDLTTLSVSQPFNVSIASGANPPLPYSVGINSQTPQPLPGVAPIRHRAVVAYQSTNRAMILDVSVVAGTPVISEVQTIGGSPTSFSTGANPAVAIDPRLNWAVITPGGGGTINIVDLGRDSVPLRDTGRSPQVVATISLSTTARGVGINSETHEALFTDPQATGTLKTFSLLDQTSNTITLPAGVSQKNYVSGAASALENIGIAVSSNPTGNSTAIVVDMENGTVLENFNGLGINSQGVAIDPVSNQAVVANQGDDTVSILSLAPSIKPLQIVEATPSMTYGGPGAADLPITIVGSVFVGGSTILLDGQPIPGPSSVSANGRQITVSIPGAMLSAARRYIVQVQNPDASVSNVTDLTVVQPIAVGKNPVGVAVDTDRDLAVVTNSTDGTATLVSLDADPSRSPESLGPVGPIATVNVGTNPAGVAVIPRLGRALVANNGSNNVTMIDLLTQLPTTGALCGATCEGPSGVAINQDTAIAAVTNTNSASSTSPGSVSMVNVSGSTPAVGISPSVDQNPIAVAVNPTLNYAAVATASQASSVQLVNMATGVVAGRIAGTGMQNPSGIVFDPINQVFVAANSLLNDVLIIDPNTFIQIPVSVGIAPSSGDYNFQTSTLVTVNSVSHTMSVLSYVCPPGAGVPACVGTKVRSIIPLGGPQVALPVFGPNALAIDPKLSVAAVVDPDNNRLLLIPLPH